MNTTRESAQGYQLDDRNEAVLVYVNGRFVPRHEASVSVFDSGFVLGDGIWEGLRQVDGRLISLSAHLDRLYEGARSIDLDIGMDREALVAAIRETLARNGMQDGAHIRLMITRGLKRTPNQDPRFVIGPPTVVIVAEYKRPKGEVMDKGLTLFTSTFRTSTPDVFDLHLNSHSRLNLIQALIQALHAGAGAANSGRRPAPIPFAASPSAMSSTPGERLAVSPANATSRWPRRTPPTRPLSPAPSVASRPSVPSMAGRSAMAGRAR